MRSAVWLVLTSAAFAQNSGTITGKVSDTFGEAVSGASIQARNTVTGAEYKATSTATSEYALEKLPPGAYELSVTMITMKRYVRQDIGVQAAQTLRLDITLEDGSQLGTLGDGNRFTAAARQNRPAPPSGPARRMPDGKPDLSGFWPPPQGDPSVQPQKPEGLPWAEGDGKPDLSGIWESDKNYLGSDPPNLDLKPESVVLTPEGEALRERQTARALDPEHSFGGARCMPLVLHQMSGIPGFPSRSFTQLKCL